MKKKLEKHVMEIATHNETYCYQYKSDNIFFVTDRVRVLRYESEIDNININAHDQRTIDVCKNTIADAVRPEFDYKLHELPKKSDIKDGITDIAGRSRGGVVYSDDMININARYLFKAMDALNATVCYVPSVNNGKMPIYLYENDDLQAINMELILPVYNKHNKRGFWLVS